MVVVRKYVAQLEAVGRATKSNEVVAEAKYSELSRELEVAKARGDKLLGPQVASDKTLVVGEGKLCGLVSEVSVARVGLDRSRARLALVEGEKSVEF